MLIVMEPLLLWTIIAAIAGVIVAIPALFKLLPPRWNPFKKKPEPVELIVKGDPRLQVSFFPHATLPAAFELTNLGTVGINVSHVIISTDLIKDPTPEMYPLSVPIRVGERKPISVYSDARKYFDAHMSALYKIGRESRRPTVRVSFRCEISQGHFDTKWQTIVGRVSNAMLVDLKPPDKP